jgi:LysR family glycine cleavage system transcriptional activator
LRARKTAWLNWRRATKVDIGRAGSQTFEHVYLNLQAASVGLGVAIGSVFMVEEEIDRGRLVASFGFVRDGSAYYLLSSAPMENDPRRRAFPGCIRKQMRQAPESTRLHEA